MEVNSSSYVYSQDKLANSQKLSLKEGETLQAIPYQGTAFDNIQDSVRYQPRSTYGTFDKIVNTGTENLKIIDAENMNHTLVSGLENTRNINLYAVRMTELGKENKTQATIFIGDTFVALQTTDGDLATPFRPIEEHDKIEKVNQLLKQSKGDFAAFVEKLEAEFGNEVSVETFTEGEGPDYAQAHLLLNGTTFESFINKQTANMYEIKSIRAKALEQFEYKGDGDMPHGLKITDKSKVHFVNLYNDISNMTQK